jgi:hypothetical protein
MLTYPQKWKVKHFWAGRKAVNNKSSIQRFRPEYHWRDLISQNAHLVHWNLYRISFAILRIFFFSIETHVNRLFPIVQHPQPSGTSNLKKKKKKKQKQKKKTKNKLNLHYIRQLSCKYDLVWLTDFWEDFVLNDSTFLAFLWLYPLWIGAGLLYEQIKITFTQALFTLNLIEILVLEKI